MTKPNRTANLFQPLTMGSLQLQNRVVMAPLTRSRATSDGTPVPMMAEYYAQRASAGLIVSEATNISYEGRGYAYTPGIFTDAQVAAWKVVTDAIHKAGGLIFCQLWHVGRISHPDLQPGKSLPVAPSAAQPQGQAFTEEGMKPHPTPRALETGEIARLVADYRHATRCAKEAGFDGVEIHAANGYLIDQFLREKTNKRTDRYGGSVENRARFLFEVVEAVIGEWQSGRVGIRLSPTTNANDIASDMPEVEVFTHVVQRLNDYKLAYLHMVEGATGGPREIPADKGGFDLQALADSYEGVYMANNGYDRQLALDTMAQGRADLIAFGKPFIGNPDLVERLRRDLPLTVADHATFYGGGAEGYTDYPASEK